MALALPAFVLALSLAALSSAQTSADLQGRVCDASGAVIAGATVRVRNEASGFDRSANADAEGRYHIVGIPAGPYRVSAEATGFRSEVIEELTVEVGRTLVRNFRLEVAANSTSRRTPAFAKASARQAPPSLKLQLDYGVDGGHGPSVKHGDTETRRPQRSFSI